MTSSAAPDPDRGEVRAEQGTRGRVVQLVGERGPITAPQIAEHLGLTTAGVRRHLELLVQEGTIEDRDAPTPGGRRRGRPARAYVLSDQGHDSFEAEYDTLAAAVLRFLREQQGDAAVDQFARRRAQALADEIRAEVDAAGDDVDARTHALAEALRRRGHAATSRPVASGTPLAGVQLCQGHCPVQHVAAEFPEFCEAESEAFSDLLGVHVQRLASLARGDHVCTTFVPLQQVTSSEPQRKDPR